MQLQAAEQTATHEEETALVERVRQRDTAAYQLLVRKHLRPLSGYAARMLAGAPEAEDIVQETLLRLWTHASRYRADKSRLTTWLHNIAHNLCIDYFRKHKRLQPLENQDAAETLLVTTGPDTGQQQQEVQRHVAAAMMKIPERQRSAVIMCHYQGLSNREVAEILGVSVRALESLLVRGRANLKEILEHEH